MGKHKNARPLISRICPTCGKEFLSTRPEAKYCSIPCYHASYAEVVRTGRRALITAALHERYPCQEIPYGQQALMAQEFGVSREYIRQIVKAEGMIKAPAKKFTTPTRLCECGQPAPRRSSEYCDDCRYITMPCAQCGRDFTVARVKIQQAFRHVKRQGGVRFCSKKCWHESDEYHEAITRPRAPRTITRCLICDAEISRYPSSKSTGLFCSRECWKKSLSQRRDGVSGHQLMLL